MSKKRILCFGDSLTWGYDPDKRSRFPELYSIVTDKVTFGIQRE